MTPINPRLFYFYLFVSLLLIISINSQSFADSSVSTNSTLFKYLHGTQIRVEKVGPDTTTALPLGTAKGKPLFAPGEVIVKYYDNVSQNDKSRVRTRHNFSVKRKHQFLNCETLNIPSSMHVKSVDDMRSLCADIMKDPAVQFAQPNYYYYASGFGYFPNDPYFGSDTERTFDGQTIGGVEIIYGTYPSYLTTYHEFTRQINYYDEYYVVQPPPQYQDVLGGGYLPGGWDITLGNSGVKVAVIDTGVMREHEDLHNHILSGFDYIHKNALAEDDN
jgi:subtilisin family serine protease